jgi:hypothetical protein
MGIALPKSHRSDAVRHSAHVMLAVAPELGFSAHAAVHADFVKDWTSTAFVAAWRALYERTERPSPVFDPAFLIPWLASHRSNPAPVMLAVTRRRDETLELLALMLLAPAGRRRLKLFFRSPEFTQQDVAGILFSEPLMSPEPEDARASVGAICQLLHQRRGKHVRFVLKGLRSNDRVAEMFRETAEACGFPVVAVQERQPTLGLDFVPSARILPVDAVEVFSGPDDLKPALERFLAIDAMSGQLEREPLVKATGMAIFLRALVRSLSPAERIRIAIIDTGTTQAAAMAIETATECFLWRIVGRDRNNPLLEAAFGNALQAKSGKVIHAATEAPISGLGLKPLPMTSLRIEFDAFNGKMSV